MLRLLIRLRPDAGSEVRPRPGPVRTQRPRRPCVRPALTGHRSVFLNSMVTRRFFRGGTEGALDRRTHWPFAIDLGTINSAFRAMEGLMTNVTTSVGRVTGGIFGKMPVTKTEGCLCRFVNDRYGPRHRVNLAPLIRL
jgi:hypothetical protein